MTSSVDNKTDPRAAQLMSEGGDGRIDLDPRTRRNRYHSAPRPSHDLAYASSTANDISPAAFAHVEARLIGLGGAREPAIYAEALDALRGRLRRAYGLGNEVEIVFAPSGTDLEYVALACFGDHAPGGIQNILLGADEVGSGCIHSAHGRYFADRTALGIATRPGEPVEGLEATQVDLIDVKVRDEQGRVRRSETIAGDMRRALASARIEGRHALVHVVHGSKTGLILPSLGDLDRLTGSAPDSIGLVVDACQARITSEAIAEYLGRGAIVFLTGSKFMGGPPFSGMALLPRKAAAGAPPLPRGLASIFRRAEWPIGWPGRDQLEDASNPGLLMRLEAAIFELERFQRLPAADVERVILAFHAAVREEIIEKTPARRVAPYPPGEREEADSHPIEMRTLSTLDLSEFPGSAADFDQAQAWYRALIEHGIRVGQPVKCVKLGDGRWGATLRLGLSMWQIVDRSTMTQPALEASFAQEMARIREALVAVAEAC